MDKALKAGILVERFRFNDIRAKAITDDANLLRASLRAGHTRTEITRRVYDRKARLVAAAVYNPFTNGRKY